MEKSKDQRIAVATQRLDALMKADETLWRHPLADAAMRLWKLGLRVTPADVIGELESELSSSKPGRKGALEAAIKRLQDLLAEHGEEQ